MKINLWEWAALLAVAIGDVGTMTSVNLGDETATWCWLAGGHMLGFLLMLIAIRVERIRAREVR